MPENSQVTFYYFIEIRIHEIRLVYVAFREPSRNDRYFSTQYQIRRNLQPNFYDNDVIIEDVTTGFVIMKISTVRH